MKYLIILPSYLSSTSFPNISVKSPDAYNPIFVWSLTNDDYQFSGGRIDRSIGRNVVLVSVSRSRPRISHFARYRRPRHPPGLSRVRARVRVVPRGGQLRVLRRLSSDGPRVASAVIVRTRPDTVDSAAAATLVELLLLKTLRVVAAVDSPRVGPIKFSGKFLTFTILNSLTIW